MTEKTLTTENIKPALDALRGELAPWPVVAKKQDRLNTAQLNAANSGITSSLVAQIIANTAAIRALESAITGTGLRALVVATLPAVGTTGILYIVPVTTYDPDTDADVVNYSNEYIWIPVEAGQASEGHYEQVGQTGIVINNGQLTITVNGTSVGTFTANQSGDTTAAITVPTNADYVDLSTDQTIAGDKTWTGEQSFTLPIVGSITGTASKAIADEDGTSIKTGYVNVAGTQTVTGDKSFTGSNTFNNILPNATNTYSLGSSSYQWSSVYAQTYYYNGTAWGLDKANVWTNVNKFNGSTNTVVNLQRGGSSYYSDIRFADETSHILSCIRASTELQIGCQRSSNWTDGSQIIFKNNGSLQFVLNDGTNTTSIIANATEIKPTNSVADLGSSTNQWKSVYAQTYYYKGTAWGLDKSNTWTGSNTFTSVTTKNKVDRTVAPTSDTNYGTITCRDKNGSAMFRMQGTIKTDLSNVWDMMLVGPNSAYQTFFKYTISSGTLEKELRLKADSVIPDVNSENLGTTNNPWKTLNGINPGALSLPNVSVSVAVDTTDWVYDGLTANLIKFNNDVQTFSGWLYLTAQNTSASDRIVVRYIGSDASNLTFMSGKFDGATSIFVACPIVAGVSTYVWSTKALNTIKIYKALGNV